MADLLQTLRARPAALPQTTGGAVRHTGGGARPACGHPGGERPGIARPRHRRRAHDRRRTASGTGGAHAARWSAAARGHPARGRCRRRARPLGSLPDDEIREGLALLGEDLLVPLGTAVVCRGGDPGRVAMRVTVHRSGWPTQAPIEVRAGQLQVVPLARGQEAELIDRAAARRRAWAGPALAAHPGRRDRRGRRPDARCARRSDRAPEAWRRPSRGAGRLA